MSCKENAELDILYNLLTYINASYSQDMYYTICYQVLNNIEKIANALEIEPYVLFIENNLENKLCSR